jgi:hypothetical protein
MRRLFPVAMLFGAVSSHAFAEDQSVGARIGMLGIGVEYSYRLSDRIAIRGGLNGASFGFDDTESGIAYDFNLDFDSLSVGVDLHPLKGPFRVSVGALRNSSAIAASSTPIQPIDIGGTVYQPADVGSLLGSIAFDGTAPFLSVGWDFRFDKKLGMTFELGVVDQGGPVVTLEATGPIASDVQFMQDVATERLELEDAFADLDLYPFAMLGMAFRF